ncbi:hypothetical protein BDF21DRAFT_458573 [Thamnidium elegans]|nr:hypothetical protein BDF21DRAFT_458573 [Thamnidium elegans]
MLTDGSSFKIIQTDACVSDEKTFEKHMEISEEFCCPYTTKDCSCHRRNHDEAIYFYFASGYLSAKIVKCTTGGGLYIHGTENDYFAECVDANGVSTIVSIDQLGVP